MHSHKTLLTFLILITSFLNLSAQKNCDKALAYKDKISVNHRNAYAAHYFALKCECVDKGAISDQQEQQILAAMVHDRKSFEAYSGNLSELGPLPSACERRGSNASNNPPKNPSGNKQENNTNNSTTSTGNDDFNSDWDRVNNVSDIQGFVGLIAEDSDSEALKKMSQSLNKNKETFSLIQDFSSSLGLLDQSSLDFLENAELLSELFIVGKGIFESFKEAELTPEQKEVIKNMFNLNYNLKEIYTVVNAVPVYYTFNEKSLRELEKKALSITNYKNNTAKERLLYLIYFNRSTNWDNAMLENWKQQLINWENAKGTQYLFSKIDDELAKIGSEYILEEKDFEYTTHTNQIEPHLLNNTKANSGSLHSISIQKMKCYRALGQLDKAKKIENNLSFKISASSSITQLIENYRNNNNRNALKYYEVFKEQIISSETFNYIYTGIRNLYFDNIDGLFRRDVQMINLSALRAYLAVNDIENAQQTLQFMESYHNELVSFLEKYQKKNIRKRSMGLTLVEIEKEINVSATLLEIAKTTFSIKNEKEKIAIAPIFTKAAEEFSTIGLNVEYRALLLYYQTSLYINSKDFQKADESLKQLKNVYGLCTQKNQLFFTDNDISFFKAFLNKQKNKNSLVVLGLKSILKNNPNELRSLRLLYQTYTDMEKPEKAQETLNSLKSLTI